MGELETIALTLGIIAIVGIVAIIIYSNASHGIGQIPYRQTPEQYFGGYA